MKTFKQKYILIFLGLVTCAGIVYGQTFSIERISLTDSDQQATGGFSDQAVMSGDNRYVVFRSAATDLVSQAAVHVYDLYIRDRELRTTTLIPQISGGGRVDNISLSPAISQDGSTVVYRSDATDIVDGDTNAASDIFMYSVSSGENFIVSTDNVGNIATGGGSFEPEVSSDGTFVAFASYATSFIEDDTNGVPDIFVKNTQTGEVVRVSESTLGAESDGPSLTLAISGDGRYVAFASMGTNLVGSDNNAEADIFLHDTQTSTTTRVSITNDGDEASGGYSFRPDIDRDNGRYITFNSYKNDIVGDDMNTSSDVFLYDRNDGSVTLVSKAYTTGDPANGESTSARISDDGQYIVFQSDADDIVEGDTNGFADVFVYRVSDGSIQRVSLRSNGEQTVANQSREPYISDGQYIIFKSDANDLVDGDTNTYGDVFMVQNPFYAVEVPEGELEPTSSSRRRATSRRSRANVQHLFAQALGLELPQTQTTTNTQTPPANTGSIYVCPQGFTQYMQRGFSDLQYGISEVVKLQIWLGNLGYIPGKLDGVYGLNTKLAVQAFQAANGLQKVDGKFGAETRMKVNEIVCN